MIDDDLDDELVERLGDMEIDGPDNRFGVGLEQPASVLIFYIAWLDLSARGVVVNGQTREGDEDLSIKSSLMAFFFEEFLASAFGIPVDMDSNIINNVLIPIFEENNAIRFMGHLNDGRGVNLTPESSEFYTEETTLQNGFPVMNLQDDERQAHIAQRLDTHLSFAIQIPNQRLSTWCRVALSPHFLHPQNAIEEVVREVFCSMRHSILQNMADARLNGVEARDISMLCRCEFQRIAVIYSLPLLGEPGQEGGVAPQ